MPDRILINTPDGASSEELARFFGSALATGWSFVDTGSSDHSALSGVCLAKPFVRALDDDGDEAARVETESLISRAGLSHDQTPTYFVYGDWDETQFPDVSPGSAVYNLVGTQAGSTEARKVLQGAFDGLIPGTGPIVIRPFGDLGEHEDADTGKAADPDADKDAKKADPDGDKDAEKDGDQKADPDVDKGQDADESKKADSPSKDKQEATPVDETLGEPGIADLQMSLWRATRESAKESLAEKYFDRAVKRYDVQTKTAAWKVAAEPCLFAELDDVQGTKVKEETAKLRADLIRARNGIPTELDIELGQKRLAVVDEQLEVSRELRRGMAEWRSLAKKAPKFLLGGLVVGTCLLVAAVALTWKDKINGVELGVVVFTAALFAISPAVLLLIERPLAGLDKYSPSGSANGDGDGDAEADKPKQASKGDEKKDKPAAAEGAN